MKIFDESSKLIGAIVLAFAFSFYSIFSWGYVLHSSYWWFVKPAISFAPSLGYFKMVGVVVFWRLLNFKLVEKTELDYWRVAIAPWLGLLLAWLVKIVVS